MKTLLLCLSIVLWKGSVYSHSGGTDWKGGHLNHRTYEYHYHHGLHAHQHVNDLCVFEPSNKEFTTESPGKTLNRNLLVGCGIVISFIALITYFTQQQ